MNRNQNKKWALLTAVMLASGLAVLPTAIHAATAVSGTEKANENGAEATDGTSAKSTAVGDKATAKDGGTAVGSGASATSEDAIAMGNGASSVQGVAIGHNAKTTVTSAEDHSSVAIGCEATSNGGIAIGHKATSDGGLAMGVSAASKGGIAIGGNAISDNEGASAVGMESYAATNATAYGTFATARGTSSVAIGDQASAETDRSIAIGFQAHVQPQSQGKTDTYIAGVAIGWCASTWGEQSIAIGTSAQVEGDYGVAVGNNAVAYPHYSTSVGYKAYAYGEKSAAFGANTYVDATNAVAIGNESRALESDTVSVGRAEYKEYVGAPDYWKIYPEIKRRITYVADGIKDTDAATYGQLVDAQAIRKDPSDSTSEITGYTTYTPDSEGIVTVLTNNGGTAFKIKVGTSGGGGATYTGDNKTISISDTNVISVKTDGTVTKDSTGIVTGQTVYNAMVTGGSYNSSTGKLHFTNGKGEDAFSIAIEGSGVIYKGDDKTIGISDSNEISVKYDATDLTVNDNGLAVKKDGKVEAGNEGLVTGGAVYDALQDMNHRTEQLTNDINKVGAGAAALAALRPEGFDPDDKWSFAVGYGHYKNANAGALGAFFKPNADTTVSFSSTVGNGDPMMNAGVSFKLGQRGKNGGVYRHAVELVARVDALEATDARHEALLAAQADQIAAQRQEIAALRADNEQMKRQIATILSKMEMSDQVMPSAR